MRIWIPQGDPDYERLLTDVPLKFDIEGFQLETPDLARYLTAQSGVEMLESLKRNIFEDYEVPSKWECGTAPPIARYTDQIWVIARRVAPAFPIAETQVTRRGSPG